MADTLPPERLWDQVYSNSPMGIALVGLNGEWLDVNDRLPEIVGYSKAELLERTFQAITHPDDVKPDVAMLEEIKAGKRHGYRMTKRYITKFGKVAWVGLSVQGVYDGNGQLRHFVSHIQPLYANGHDPAKTTTNGHGEIVPAIKWSEFARQNWKFLTALGTAIVAGLGWVGFYVFDRYWELFHMVKQSQGDG